MITTATLTIATIVLLLLAAIFKCIYWGRKL